MKKVKVSDAIVEFLITNRVSDVFGYPGGMIVHLMDSIRKQHDSISFHLSYHEQGAAFEACSWAQITGKTGVAIATSGPGATNLITGIANAYFDSIPVIFITGQVNTNESARNMPIRQRGFQETDICSVVKPITKAAFYVENAAQCMEVFKEAFIIAQSGRKGPVLIDLPMNVQRAEIDGQKENPIIYPVEEENVSQENEYKINSMLHSSKRPLIILGNGIRNSKDFSKPLLRNLITKIGLPVALTLPAVDLLESGHSNNYGLIGAYGNRIANILAEKSDLIIALGARLDVRQVGGSRRQFAPKANIIRVDIDRDELSYKVHDDDINICADGFSVLKQIECDPNTYIEWNHICTAIRKKLQQLRIDELSSNNIAAAVSQFIPDDAIITTDVGQNQIWMAQSFQFQNQDCLTSSGIGSMGYSLPAAIGAYYACEGKKRVFSFNGDGGIQMNLQELGVIAREKLPITVIVFNNKALGMIRAFQEIYFDDYYLTTENSGYENPDFAKIAEAYGMGYFFINGKDNKALNAALNNIGPTFIEIYMNYPTYIYPKLKFGERNDNQMPYLPDDILNWIRSL